jgi:hypothetical protein
MDRPASMVLRRTILSAIRRRSGVDRGPARSYCSSARQRVAGSRRIPWDTEHHGSHGRTCRGGRSGANRVSARGRRRCRNVRAPACASCRGARDWHGALVFGGTSGADGRRSRSYSQRPDAARAREGPAIPASRLHCTVAITKANLGANASHLISMPPRSANSRSRARRPPTTPFGSPQQMTP